MARELGYASAADWLKRVSSQEVTEWMAVYHLEEEDRKNDPELLKQEALARVEAMKRRK